MRPSPYQIHAFTHAAREKSFSKAAIALGVTQSSVTQHVARLEHNMGARLFVRRRDGLEMTRAGLELFSVSDRLTTLEQLVQEKVQRYASLTSGHLRIIATAPRPAMPIIERYCNRYPQVQIEFSLFNWTLCSSIMYERHADIAIFTEPEPDAGLHVREIETTRYLAHMRQDHRFARRKALTLRELQEETLILPEDGSFTQRVFDAKSAEHGLSPSRVMKTTTFPVLKEAILHGIGVGLFLEDSLYPSRNLAAVPIADMPEIYRNCLVTPADKHNLRLVQSFIDMTFGDIGE